MSGEDKRKKLEELKYYIQVLADEGKEITEWEQNLINSITQIVAADRVPSVRQLQSFMQIYEDRV